MAQRRGLSGRGHSLSSPLPRKKYALRRSPPHRSIQPALGPVQSEDASRGPLLPLHQNLRRLPSRMLAKYPDSDIMDDAPPVVGDKRKRNENTRFHGRPDRGTGRTKRLKAANGARQSHSSDEESDSSRDDDGDGSGSSKYPAPILDTTDTQLLEDQYFIHSAPSQELHRLLKDELLRLYTLAGLGEEDSSAATKHDIVDAIVSARDDLEELPPSSPRGDGHSSGYSSEEHESDLLGSPGSSKRPGGGQLRRRATTNGQPSRALPRPTKTRTMSWNVPVLQLPQRRNLARRSSDAEVTSTPIARFISSAVFFFFQSD